jgi:folate-dependent tRNA-U54 methylase TrmFO/GidA
MNRPRVAVVGAAPASSTAARLLAARGAEVILFEARPLPRAKICGGGLTPKAQRLVPDSALRVVERRVERVELFGPHVQPTSSSGVQLSTQVRERAVDAIAGRRAPYAIDGHCELACTCETHAYESSAGAPDFSASTRPMRDSCRICPTSRAA